MIPDFSLTGFDGTVLRSHGMLTKNQAKEKETVFFDGWFFFWGLPLALLARALPGNWGLWGLLAVSVGFLTEFPSPLKYLWLGINAASWLWQAGKSREWGSLPEAGLYVTLFSKAAGPWISWKDFRRQLRHPLTWDGFGAGCEMYIAGLLRFRLCQRFLFPGSFSGGGAEFGAGNIGVSGRRPGLKPDDRHPAGHPGVVADPGLGAVESPPPRRVVF